MVYITKSLIFSNPFSFNLGHERIFSMSTRISLLTFHCIFLMKISNLWNGGAVIGDLLNAVVSYVCRTWPNNGVSSVHL